MKTAAQLDHQLKCEGVIRDALRNLTDQEVVSLLFSVAACRLPDAALEDLGNRLGRHPHMKRRDGVTA